MDFCSSKSTNKKAPYLCGKVPSHIHPNDYACLEKKESNSSLSLRTAIGLSAQLSDALQASVLDFVLHILGRVEEDAATVNLLCACLLRSERCLGRNRELESTELLHVDGVTIQNHLFYLLDN